MRAPTLCFVLLACSGCGPSWNDLARGLAPPAEAPAPERRDVRRVYWDRAATKPKSETGWLLRRDGSSVKDGVERRWYESGQLEYERHWTRDQPAGLWRAWFEDGTQRFEHLYDPERATPMTWWHASGAISSAGPAREGVRDGPWRGDHPDGARAFAGAFVANRRHGFWIFWHPDGSVETSGHYQGGERVGVWESYAPGAKPADDVKEPAAGPAAEFAADPPGRAAGGVVGQSRACWTIALPLKR